MIHLLSLNILFLFTVYKCSNFFGIMYNIMAYYVQLVNLFTLSGPQSNPYQEPFKNILYLTF